jgi:K+-sensing histidine kinase KdpD
MVRFEAREGVREVVIDCVNNGAPFPAGFAVKDFLAFGKKGKNSPGKGLGGAWVGKFVEVHGGDFRKMGDDPVHFRITIPKRRRW